MGHAVEVRADHQHLGSLAAQHRPQVAGLIGVDLDGLAGELEPGALEERGAEVLDGGEATEAYYEWLIKQLPEGATVRMALVDAHRIGRKCCEFWCDYTDQPDVSPDPNDWELSDLDIRTAVAGLVTTYPNLGDYADAVRNAALLEALHNGFEERRGELVEAAQ